MLLFQPNIANNLKSHSINHVSSSSEVDSYLDLHMLLTEATTFKQLPTYGIKLLKKNKLKLLI